MDSDFIKLFKFSNFIRLNFILDGWNSIGVKTVGITSSYLSKNLKWPVKKNIRHIEKYHSKKIPVAQSVSKLMLLSSPKSLYVCKQVLRWAISVQHYTPKYSRLYFWLHDMNILARKELYVNSKNHRLLKQNCIALFKNSGSLHRYVRLVTSKLPQLTWISDSVSKKKDPSTGLFSKNYYCHIASPFRLLREELEICCTNSANLLSNVQNLRFCSIRELNTGLFYKNFGCSSIIT